ncbi:MAG: efflux RND transporter periplasmic adaptor subunit [Ignavibacteria bacterium]|nr:efflux RND transporter periplasmic adaptor subunit [Ignavibacteria bacterium]
MSKKIKYISVSLIVIILAAAFLLPKILSGSKTDKVQKSGPDSKNMPLPANGFIVKAEELDNKIKVIGSIVANEEVELRSELSRKITGIYFKEGTFVSKGKLLFKLDDSDLMAQMNKLIIQSELTELNLNRTKELFDKSLSTREEYDIIQNENDALNAELEILDVQIDKTNIRAPFSGIIGFKNVSSGSYVTPSVILANIQEIGRVKLDFSIPEKYITVFNKGQGITFNVEGIDEEFTGVISAFEPKLDGNTRSLTVRAICQNPGNKLIPGTFANVNLNLSSIKDAILIPTQALIPKLKGHDVFVLNNGTARLTDVTSGMRTENLVQIISGINPGDTVITTNILRLKNGSPVVIDKIESQ